MIVQPPCQPRTNSSINLSLINPSIDYPPSPGRAHPDYKSLVLQMELPPSPAKSDTTMAEPTQIDGSATEREKVRITRNLDRGAPGDKAISSQTKTPEARELAKKRSQYYSDAFAHREPIASARERVTKEAMVMADVKTNVIIQDEYTFITDLSYTLSNRYQRPENSILVSLAHSCCLLYGGSFDPAYTLTITALPGQVQPVTNKRNASLLAKAMEESLGVAPSRGIIKFIAIPEENFAHDGKTIAGEIEELEKELGENSSLVRSLSKATNRSKKRQSMRSLRGKLSDVAESKQPTPYFPDDLRSPTEMLETSQTPQNMRTPIPPTPTEMSTLDKKADKVQKMSRRKSFIATIFGKH